MNEKIPYALRSGLRLENFEKVIDRQQRAIARPVRVKARVRRLSNDN
ncbi:MAG: hypothetical protein DVB23_000948 [Verrucomicrobia bacterium]|nr:MAG: hypothetical protein DVB23_000948 [Verrucomicrobiota bacterium]